MPSAPKLTRRSLIAGLVLTPVAMACSPAAPASQGAATAPAAKPTTAAPTVAPAAKPAQSASPAAAAGASPVASAAASPAAAPKPSGATVTLPKPEQTSVKIGFSALEAIMSSYFLAADTGLFKKYGFENVELIYSEGDTKALQALVSGGVDATAQGPSVDISSQLVDTPTVMASMSTDKLTSDLMGAADIKTAADLKGKKVGISAFGGTSHATVLLALRGLSLSPNDVSIVQVGGEAARVAALKAGSVAAADVEIFRRPDMKAQGFNLLISVAETPGLEYPRNGFNFLRDYMDKNPNTVLALVAAVLEGQQALYTEAGKQQAIDSYAQRAQITNRADATTRLESLLPYFRRDMSWSKGAFEFAKEVLASQNAAISSVDVTKAYTYQFLDKLAQMGFQDSIGAPAPKKG